MYKSLKTKNILLEEFSSDFITEKYINWLNNKDLMKFSEQRHKKHTLESCEKYLKDFAQSNALFFAVLDSKSKIHVGNINAYIDNNNQVGDIGILIAESGKGYGYNAWIEMIKILFVKKKLRKITAGTMKLNIPMIRIFTKSGMRYEHTKKNQFIFEGNPVDSVSYSIFIEDYK